MSGHYGFIKICLTWIQRSCFIFLQSEHERRLVVLRTKREKKKNQILGWLQSRTHRSRPAPHGTSGFPHFLASVCNRQWQAVSDGINCESEYSGGQWFLNHLCDWTRSASYLHFNNTLVTRTGAGLTPIMPLEKLGLVVYQDMAGYLEDGWQLEYDDVSFMKWGSTLNHVRHFSSYEMWRRSNKLLINVSEDELNLFCSFNIVGSFIWC